MARPNLPADGVKPWGAQVRTAIWDVSDRADNAISAATNATNTANGASTLANNAASAATANSTAITSLQQSLSGKSDDASVVKLTGNQTINGIKTFVTAPVVPDNSFAISKVTGLQDALNAGGGTGGGTGGVSTTDPRLSDQRTPLDNSVTNVKVPAGANISADKIADGSTNKVFTLTLATKLAGIATGATANSTDAALRDRTTHTGLMPVSGAVPGTSLKVIWNSSTSQWTYNGAVITARPGNRTDINLDFIGGTEANRPTWGNQPGDTQLVTT